MRLRSVQESFGRRMQIAREADPHQDQLGEREIYLSYLVEVEFVAQASYRLDLLLRQWLRGVLGQPCPVGTVEFEVR